MGRRPSSPDYRDQWHRERQADKRQRSAAAGWSGRVLLILAVLAAVLVIASVL